MVASKKYEFGISFPRFFSLFYSKNDTNYYFTSTILQENTSGIISLKEKNITSFKDLNKNYASWQDSVNKGYKNINGI